METDQELGNRPLYLFPKCDLILQSDVFQIPWDGVHSLPMIRMKHLSHEELKRAFSDFSSVCVFVFPDACERLCRPLSDSDALDVVEIGHSMDSELNQLSLGFIPNSAPVR